MAVQLRVRDLPYTPVISCKLAVISTGSTEEGGGVRVSVI